MWKNSKNCSENEAKSTREGMLLRVISVRTPHVENRRATQRTHAAFIWHCLLPPLHVAGAILLAHLVRETPPCAA